MVNDIQSRRGHAVQTGRPRWFRKTESSVTQIYEGGRGGGAAASISHSCFNTINLGNLIDTVIEFMYRVCSVTTITIVIHSIGTRRTRRFLAVLRSFFHSSLLYTLYFHPFQPTSLPPSITSTCHLFLGPPLSLVVSKFIYNTFFGGGILFSSILCTCPNQRNQFNLIVSVRVEYSTIAHISLLVNILQFSFSLSRTGPKILLYTFLSKMFICFLSLFVSLQVSGAFVYYCVL